MESIKTEVVDDQQKRDTHGRKISEAERRAELLVTYDASGLTESAFARREGVNFHTFVAWLGAAVVGVSQLPQFATGKSAWLQAPKPTRGLR